MEGKEEKQGRNRIECRLNEEERRVFKPPNSTKLSYIKTKSFQNKLKIFCSFSKEVRQAKCKIFHRTVQAWEKRRK